MKIPMFGFNRHRLKVDGYHNKEVAYMKIMQKFADQSSNFFDMAVFGPNGSMSPNSYLTERETKIVASILQWLGTPVGEAYLRESNEMIEALKIFDGKNLKNKSK